MYMYVYLSPRPREISRYSKPEQTKNKDLLTFAFWYTVWKRYCTAKVQCMATIRFYNIICVDLFLQESYKWPGAARRVGRQSNADRQNWHVYHHTTSMVKVELEGRWKSDQKLEEERSWWYWCFTQISLQRRFCATVESYQWLCGFRCKPCVW